jgi:hypothetical protein
MRNGSDRPLRSMSLAALALFAALLAPLAPACDRKTDKPGARVKPVVEMPAHTGSAVVKGVVKFAGAVPPPEPWAGAGNAECRKLHPETMQLVKVQDGKVEDAFVYVKDGLPPGTYPASSQPVAFDQKGCEFTPRVLGVFAGQAISATNSDRLLHNVKSPEWNQAFPYGLKRDIRLDHAAVMATIACDVHPWMRAYVGVMEHPYFAVTKADGAFELDGLVDGELTVAVWHEKLGTAEKKVKTTAGTPITIELDLPGK